MTRLSLGAAWVFGAMLVAHSLFVTLETASRKLFNHSFQGADELGGYVLAIGGALSFSVALIERGHIRIDLIHDRLPAMPRAVLNWCAYVCLAVFGLFMGWYCLQVVIDSNTYGSRAPTAWATPMIWPQSVWYVALLLFTVTGLFLAAKASLMLLRGDLVGLNGTFDAKGVLDELNDELDDLKKR